MKHTQLVLIEFDNCAPFVYMIVSNKPITIDRVAQYYIKSEGFNEERDSITFLDEPTEVNLDKKLRTKRE